jgi:hypothetical protein
MPRRQIQQFGDRILGFGFTNPVLIDDATIIIADHGPSRRVKLLARGNSSRGLWVQLTLLYFENLASLRHLIWEGYSSKFTPI